MYTHIVSTVKIVDFGGVLSLGSCSAKVEGDRLPPIRTSATFRTTARSFTTSSSSLAHSCFRRRSRDRESIEGEFRCLPEILDNGVCDPRAACERPSAADPADGAGVGADRFEARTARMETERPL